MHFGRLLHAVGSVSVYAFAVLKNANRLVVELAEFERPAYVVAGKFGFWHVYVFESAWEYWRLTARR